MGNVVQMKENKVSPITEVKLAEHERREFVAYTPSGVTIEDVKKPEYWAYVAHNFTPYSTYIDVLAIDASWTARLLVTSCERNWAKVFVIYHHELVAEKKNIPESDFKVDFVPAHKWRVVRKSDSEVICKNMASRDEANKWLESYEANI